MKKPWMVVGAGFAGSVVARRLADAGEVVMMVDRRNHACGNAYDSKDEHGVLIHRYGPHIFHTNSQRVVDFLSRFTEWRDYEHRSQMFVRGKLVPFPVNFDTYRMLGLSTVGLPISDETTPLTAEDYQFNNLGRQMTELLSRPYTRKQWDLDLRELAASVVSRNPPRKNYDDRTFLDSFQKMPKHGYLEMFTNMLTHPNIELEMDSDFKWWRDLKAHGHVIYTGAIDEYFDHRLGRLPYRSMRFHHVHFDNRDFVQQVGTVGYPEPEFPFTRSTESKHLTGQACQGTTVTYEHSAAQGDPYYPIPRPENQELYRRYRELAKEKGNVTFVGRLATYMYMNMDQVVAQALKTADDLLGERYAGR